MKCAEVQSLFSCYLDDAVSRAEMRAVGIHLEQCRPCSAEHRRMVHARNLIAALGRKEAPPELALRLQVALSQAVSNSHSRRWQSMQVRWSNTFSGFMLPATAGLVSAVLFFGLLLGYIAAPASVEASSSTSDEVPLALFTPAQLNTSPFLTSVGSMEGSLVVETWVDAQGRVVDYRIISAPEGTKRLIPDLDNMMLFTTFRPAMDLGRPTASRVVLSFSGINVRG